MVHRSMSGTDAPPKEGFLMSSLVGAVKVPLAAGDMAVTLA
jgi:hypothetical protein